MKQAAKFLIVVGVLMMLVGYCFGAPPDATARARAALALSRAPYTPGTPQTCPCGGPDSCTCDLAGGRCACRACLTEPVNPKSQEEKWRAEGWRRDGAGQWYRPLTPTELQQWQPPVMVPAFAPIPMQSFGGGGGGFGGGC